MTRFLFAALLRPALAACNIPEEEAAPAAATTIVGRWAMVRVYDGGEDVTIQHNPGGNRWITFAADGTFVSDGDPHGRNTGRWSVDAASDELYIDSDAGEDDDSYWTFHVAGDTMQWRGARSDFTERVELVHAHPHAR